MRKITKDIANAMYARKNTIKDNSQVRYFSDTGLTVVYLLDNVIADYDHKGELRIFDGGYRSNTTKERLNGLLHGTNFSIYQKNFEWYIRDNRNKYDIPFENGFTILT